jgi:hypothetical protein
MNQQGSQLEGIRGVGGGGGGVGWVEGGSMGKEEDADIQGAKLVFDSSMNQEMLVLTAR